MEFTFPEHVAGWMHPLEGEELQRLAIGKHVVEIGSFKGLSTIIMAKVAKRVVAIDPFDRCEVTRNRDTFPTFRENVYSHGVEDKVITIVATAEAACPLIQPHSFDLALIDGEHTYDAVMSNIRVVAPLIKPDGLLLFHDYGHVGFPGVKAAVDTWRLSRPFKLVHTLAAVQL